MLRAINKLYGQFLVENLPGNCHHIIHYLVHFYTQMSAQNQAAWLKTAKGAFVVDSAPLWVPKDNEVLVKNVSVAINPVDYKVQGTPSTLKHHT
jgi:hypothetical protein